MEKQRNLEHLIHNCNFLPFQIITSQYGIPGEKDVVLNVLKIYLKYK